MIHKLLETSSWFPSVSMKILGQCLTIDHDCFVPHPPQSIKYNNPGITSTYQLFGQGLNLCPSEKEETVLTRLTTKPRYKMRLINKDTDLWQSVYSCSFQIGEALAIDTLVQGLTRRPVRQPQDHSNNIIDLRIS